MWQDKVVSFFRAAVSSGNFNRVLNQVRITEVHKGRLVAELEVDKESSNVLGMLHGGMSATLVDHFSTAALRSHFLADGLEPPSSVSLELSLSYLAAVPKGNTIRLETEALRVGRKVAFLTANIIDAKSGKLVVTGKHTKYLL